MKLTYETAVATFIQFIALSFLNIANGTNSVVTTCRHNNPDCVTNLMLSLVFFILTALWFAAIWTLGFMAQDRRSKRLAQLLIAAEALIAVIALFNAKHHTDILSLMTSLVDMGLAIWIILLAWRLVRAGGGRVVTRRRPRHRRRPAS